MKTQRGFTLIELVVVIIILGVLSAVAVPKFNDISLQARDASARGVAGSLAAASSLNFASRQLNTAGHIVIANANVCNQGVNLRPLVDGVTLVNAAPANDKEFRLMASLTAGANSDCSVAGGSRTTATCAVLAYGTGATRQDVSIVCAR